MVPVSRIVTRGPAARASAAGRAACARGSARSARTNSAAGRGAAVAAVGAHARVGHHDQRAARVGRSEQEDQQPEGGAERRRARWGEAGPVSWSTAQNGARVGSARQPRAVHRRAGTATVLLAGRRDVRDRESNASHAAAHLDVDVDRGHVPRAPALRRPRGEVVADGDRSARARGARVLVMLVQPPV